MFPGTRRRAEAKLKMSEQVDIAVDLGVVLPPLPEISLFEDIAAKPAADATAKSGWRGRSTSLTTTSRPRQPVVV